MEHVDDIEDHLFLLNVSNRKRLQVYLHLHDFPDETYFQYPLGDVPKYSLAVLFKQALRMEIFEDSSPYIYDESLDRVVYRKDFGHLNPEAILPEAEDWIDGLKIAKVTTWSHESGPELEAASGYNAAELKDKIDFVFWAK